jgi:hypothetical protein
MTSKNITIMKAIYAKDIKAMVKKFNLTDDESEKASLYNELWNKANNYALENLQGEQADYFYHLTD